MVWLPAWAASRFDRQSTRLLELMASCFETGNGGVASGLGCFSLRQTKYKAIACLPDHPDLECRHDPMTHEPQHPDNCVPCKLLAFADRGDGTILALVHGCHFRTTQQDMEHDTVLLEFWRLDYHDLYKDLPLDRRNKVPRGGRAMQGQHDYKVPFLCWVDTKSILSRCLVVEEEPGLHETQPRTKPKGRSRATKALDWVMLVRQHSIWPEQFT